jgi:hypothetical protein
MVFIGAILYPYPRYRYNKLNKINYFILKNYEKSKRNSLDKF